MRFFSFVIDRSRPLAMTLAGVAFAGGLGSCGDDEPAPIVLHNDTLTVTIGAPRFSLEVKNAAGVVLLTTIDEKGSYIPFAGAHRKVDYESHVLEGWDYQKATDTFIDLATVTHETHSANSATLQLGPLEDDDDSGDSAEMTISIDDGGLHIDSTLKGAKAKKSEEDHAPPGLNLASMAFELPQDEHFFGLGERLITVDHRGTTYESWVEEGGVGLGEGVPPGPDNPSPNGPQMSHAPIPFFTSSRGYGAWIQSSYRTGTSFGGERADAWRLWAFEPGLHLTFFIHDQAKDSLAAFTASTGRASLPAPWVFGPRRRIDRNAMVDGVPEIELMRQKDVPCTGADDATHYLPIGSEVGNEDEINQWTSDLHRLGYKPIAYYNAYVSATDEHAAADYKEGHDNGYFVTLADGSEFDTFMISAGPQTVATIDMTNPSAVAWFGGILDRALDDGYDGFMLDFGEYIPPEAKMFDGRSGWEAHNAFPVDYQRATWEHMTETRGNDFMYFARAGYTGTQAYIPVHWSGDPDASFDDTKGLPSQIRAGINAGLSGIPFWGSDISGYTCLNNPPADKEVFLRWAEFGALSSDMHEENACSGGVTSHQKWTLWSDEETTTVYGNYARLHTRLLPYLYAAAQEAVDTGLPVMRHPLLVDSTNPEAYGVTMDYFFGPSLYVAPVARRGDVTRDLWLPTGEWVDWWTLEPLSSGYVTRDAPLDTLPLFLKSGGIVAMLDPSVQTLASANDPSVVSIDDVQGVLDVRAAIDPTTQSGTAQLVDGTKLDMALAGGAVALPAGFTVAADEAALSTCESCGLIEQLPTGVQRVRLSTSSSTQSNLTAGALTLSQSGTITNRIRWDVAVLP